VIRPRSSTNVRPTAAKGAFLALPTAATIQAILSTYIHCYDLIDNELLKERQAASPVKPAGVASEGDLMSDRGHR
jgi:hypothetical protein